jgi:pimeloyl-ACP methyl ester carboxylesterase
MPHVLVSHGNLYYETHGAGSDLILLHGMWSHHGVWSRMVPALEKTFRLILVDHMGHGRSGRLQHAYRLRDYAADLLQLVDVLQIEKAVLAGFSMGSRVAQEFYARHSNRVSSLVLIATPPPYKLRWMLGIALVSLLERLHVTTLKKETIKALSRRYARGANRSFIEKSLQELSFFDDREFALILRSVWETFPRAGRATIRVPTLLLAGEHDGIREHTEALARRIAGSRLRIVPGADHSVMLDAPDLVAEEILAFLGFHQMVKSA